eukprot:766541_1
MWFFVSMIFPSTDPLFKETWTDRFNISADSDLTSKYIVSLYWMITTFTTVGYGDITPRTLIERIFASIIMMFGLASLAYLTANFTSVVTQHDSAKTELEIKMAGILKFCSHYKLPRYLVTQIRSTLSKRLNEQSQLMAESADVLQMLPEQVRAETGLHVYADLIKATPFFDDKSDAFISDLVVNFRPVHYKSGTYISTGHKQLENWYVMESGIVIARSMDRRTLLKFVSNSTLGEIPIFKNPNPLFDYKLFCSTDCTLYKVSHSIFGPIAAKYPKDFNCMKNVADVRFSRMFTQKRRKRAIRVRKDSVNTDRIGKGPKTQQPSLRRRVFKSTRNEFTELFKKKKTQKEAPVSISEISVNVPSSRPDLDTILDMLDKLKGAVMLLK